mgnify:CR=1 FL=1
MLKYVLPCSCGKGQLEVDSSQSGLSIPCPECGKVLEVPTMRGLRELQIAKPSGPVGSSFVWGAREGLLIVACVLFVIGLGMCIWLDGFTTLTMDPSEHSDYYPEEDLSLLQTWQYFEYIRQTGLSAEPDERTRLVEMEYKKDKSAAIALLILAGIGVVLAVIAMTVFRPKRPQYG